MFELIRTIPDPAYYYEINGIITDGITGEPIIDAKVDISGYLNGAWGHTSTQTDASGDYTITGNTRTTAKLVITKENYTPAATTKENSQKLSMTNDAVKSMSERIGKMSEVIEMIRENW